MACKTDEVRPRGTDTSLLAILVLRLAPRRTRTRTRGGRCVARFSARRKLAQHLAHLVLVGSFLALVRLVRREHLCGGPERRAGEGRVRRHGGVGAVEDCVRGGTDGRHTMSAVASTDRAERDRQRNARCSSCSSLSTSSPPSARRTFCPSTLHTSLSMRSSASCLLFLSSSSVVAGATVSLADFLPPRTALVVGLRVSLLMPASESVRGLFRQGTISSRSSARGEGREEGRRTVTEHDPLELALLGRCLEHSLLDRPVRHKAEHEHGLGLSDAVRAVHRLQVAAGNARSESGCRAL